MDSYGFTGNPNGDSNGNDPLNPNYSFVATYSQSNPELWTSGPNFPTSYLFATFYFGDPHFSPYGIAPYDGYKWKVTCVNYDGDREVRVMYGKPQ